MNIVRVLGRKSVISTFVGCTLSAIALLFALTPRTLIIMGDPRWPVELQKNITRQVEQLSVRTIGIRQLSSDLQKDYPCLKEVTITYSSRLEATVTLRGWRPLVVVQSSVPGTGEYLICEQGHILSKNFFNQAAVSGLPTLIIQGSTFEEKLHSPELINTVLAMRTELFARYAITWESKTNITLRHKEKPILIMADSSSVLENNRFIYVQRIYAVEKKYENGMRVDIRLKDSLACAPLKQGAV